MTVPFITTKHLYLQKDFPAETEKWLRILYGAAADERLLCAVWTNPVLRKGFLVTDKALRWYVTANGEKVHGALLKDVSPRVDFSISPALSAETASAIGKRTLAEELSRLEMIADGRTFTFFVKGLTEEKGKTLCDILKFAYMQGEIPQTDLAAFVKAMPLLSFRNMCDGDLNLLSSFADKILGIAKTNEKDEKNSRESANDETSGSASASESSDRTEDASKTDNMAASKEENASPTQTETIVTALQNEPAFADSLQGFLLTVLDVCASLVFVATIVVILKPELLNKFVDVKSIFNDVFGKKDSVFWKFSDFINFVRQCEARLSTIHHGVVSFGLILFFLLKMLTVFVGKTVGRKIIPILMVIMTLLAVFLAVDKFLLFLPFCLLLYFAFEYSLGLRTKSIIIKLLILLILGVAMYISAHILLISGNIEIYANIIQELKAIGNTLRIKGIKFW